MFQQNKETFLSLLPPSFLWKEKSSHSAPRGRDQSIGPMGIRWGGSEVTCYALPGNSQALKQTSCHLGSEHKLLEAFVRRTSSTETQMDFLSDLCLLSGLKYNSRV